MKINKLTITGADDKVDQSELIKLSNEYPFIEWAILFSKDRGGTQRYPTTEYITTLSEKSGVDLSAHFCGWFARAVLEMKNYELITNLPDSFKRVQLNYNFRNSSGYDLLALVEFAKTTDKAIILQFNRSNSLVLKDFVANNELPANIHFLYDSSGGNGKEIEAIGPTIETQYTGYAGGLSPDNIDKICKMIADDPEQVETWIDLESGVRTDNEFDLAKTKTIIQKTSKFI